MPGSPPSRPITERMEAARRKMVNERRRAPRVFYLGPADYEEFKATDPPTVEAKFALPLGHKPQPMTCLSYDGLAVRVRTAKPNAAGRISSVLISWCGITTTVPRE